MGRNKRCVTLDLHGEKGHKILLDLVKDADLVIENFRPGTLEKWGIGYDAMKAVNPKVVLVRISGYGQTGPYHKRRALARQLQPTRALPDSTAIPTALPSARACRWRT